MKLEFAPWYDIYFWTDSLACEEALLISVRSWARRANVNSARGLALLSPDFRPISPHRLKSSCRRRNHFLQRYYQGRARSPWLTIHLNQKVIKRSRNEWWCNLICVLNTFILVKKSHDCTDCSMVMWSQCWVKQTCGPALVETLLNQKKSIKKKIMK